jgi:hypothetical protein
MNPLYVAEIIIVVTTSVWVLIDAISIGIKRTPETKETGKSSLNMGAVAWFFACLLLWVIYFPLYLIKRGKHLAQTKNQKLQNNGALVVNCPSCKLAISVTPDLFGQAIACPTCQTVFPAPQMSGQTWYHGIGPTAIGYAMYAACLACIAYAFLGGSALTQQQLESQVRQNIQETFLKDPATKGIQIQGFNLIHDSGNKYKGMLTAQTDGKTETVEVDVTYDGKGFMWKIVPQTPAISPDTQTVSTPIETTPAQTDRHQADPVPVSPQPMEVQSDWNKKENDVKENGNIPFAVRTIMANPALRKQAKMQDPQMVAKTPWNYYGQVLKLSGQVAVVQDFPAGSDFGQALGGHDGADIVIVSQDQTIVELFCMKPSGKMRVGDTANLYGYPTGVTEVPNRLGGNDVHLILVGNDYDDLGAR